MKPDPTASLPPMDVAGRLPRLRARLDEIGAGAVLLTDLLSIRYLTGFTGSNAQLLVTDELRFVTDGRYGEQAAEQLATAGVEARIEVTNLSHEVLGPAVEPLAQLALEADHVSWAVQRRMAGEWFPGTELVATEGLVAGLRAVKDDGEIARLTAAAAVADVALDAVLPLLSRGVTEREFAYALEAEMRDLGASGPSFETIVASGPNGARPHARPSDRRIVAGDLVVVDFGALVDGYHSDMTRTVPVGEVTPTQQRMLDVVTAAQAAGVAAAGPDVPAVEVDRVCREVVAEAGWGEAFLHGTGHGVGLQIHEEPRVSTTSTATLAAGHVITVEPGVYLPEHGGVRVEDTIVITADGRRAITLAPKH